MEPVSLWAGFVGETDKNNENKHYLYTHKNIVIKYNGNRVCVVYNLKRISWDQSPLEWLDLTLARHAYHNPRPLPGLGTCYVETT